LQKIIQGPNPIHYNTVYFLYILCQSIIGKAKSKTVAEVGTGRGFSTIWLAEAAKNIGGKVIFLT